METAPAGFISEIKQLRNKFPNVYHFVEKDYAGEHRDVEVDSQGHIIIEKLTSYHAIKFLFYLCERYDL